MNTNMKRIFPIIILSAAIQIFVLLAGCQTSSTVNNTKPPQDGQNIQVGTSDSTNNQSKENGEENSSGDKVDYIKKLKAEGFDPKDIDSAELYVKRVILQLSEIQTFSDSIGLRPDISIDIHSEKADDSVKYSELLSKIDERKAVYYLVKLKKDFNNTEEVLDEYLISLQLGLDLDTYISDKKNYDKAKTEKMSAVVESDLITVNQIERKAFENLQKLNESNKNSYPGKNQDIYNPSNNLGPDINNPQPDLPRVDIPQPIDPSEEIRRRLSP
ncbi:MAG: hypothetical protein ACOYWZ_22585 [Bacillota bacterium]